MRRERKVQGAQWYVTLPKEWRNSGGHNIKKGDTLYAYFEPESVLIFNPKNREMSTLERNLSDVLIGLPKLMGTKELIENLRLIVEELSKIA
jgi:bifunctional DNA-binding transcriptional regulator/antitoxin component of YhaV-PrlF toxin-antitoxin module